MEMAVDVSGADLGGNSAKWLRGRWSEMHNSLTTNAETPHQTSEVEIGKAQTNSRKASSYRLLQQTSRKDAPIFVENEITGAVIAETEEVAGGAAMQSSRKHDGTDGHMIPLANMSCPSIKPVSARSKLMQGDRRSKVFQKAYSCSVECCSEVLQEKSPPEVQCSQELEMTYVEAPVKKIPEATQRTKTAEALLLESHSISLEHPAITSGELRDSNRATGIVCSDEDLHSILSDISHSRRLSADVKREKMKSNRSLSLDSSFFKSHMKRLQADSPNWLSRILNQRDRKDGGSTGGSGVGTPSDCESGNSDALRKKSVSKKPEVTPTTISEDAGSMDGDLSSRRESTVSGSDDECSLLLHVVNHCETLQGNTNPSITDTDQCSHNSLAPLVASKVVWNEGSVVDAEVLGHAIEYYLTSLGKRPSADHSDTCRAAQPDIINSTTVHHGGDNVAAPLMSSLKSLFV